jgi:glutamate:Na+ symporter, ESS family
MDSAWSSITNFIYLSLFLAIATVLKARFRFFKKYIIPTSIIAGLVGILLGPEVLKLVPFTEENLGNLVYHLMAIGFIALTLKDRDSRKNTDSVKTGAFIVSTYLVQGIVGFGLSLVFAYTLFPDLFPPFGLLLPLGFGQGPGQAFSIGSQWEALGFSHGGNIGLTIAALGFLWASIPGVIFMNVLIKRKKLKPWDTDDSPSIQSITESSKPGDIPLSDSIDKITVQLFLIGTIYLLTYLTLKGATALLSPLGTFGQTMSQLLWGFHFIIGTVYAMAARVIYDLLKKKKVIVQSYPNNYLLQRISGACFDYMVAASIAAISLYTLWEFLVPIMVITTVGGLVTMFYVVYISKRLYNKFILEYILALYGMLTGTISTGLALLKEVDTGFKTQVAENLVLGSAAGLALGFPLLIILNIPAVGYVKNDPIMYLYTLLALGLYLIFLLVFMFRGKGKLISKAKGNTHNFK